MGFACPVCGDPQADAEHLANHLAFTALMRGGDHEAFLDEHVPAWDTLDETALGERVSEHAERTEYPQVFEDTTGRDGSHGHDHGELPGHDHTHDGDHGHADPHRGPGGGAGGTPADSGDREPDGVGDGSGPPADVREIIKEARELTRQRRAEAIDEDSETE
jgi:hypothetical protein